MVVNATDRSFDSGNSKLKVPRDLYIVVSSQRQCSLVYGRHSGQDVSESTLLLQGRVRDPRPQR